jgi:hypothetical protein
LLHNLKKLPNPQQWTNPHQPHQQIPTHTPSSSPTGTSSQSCWQHSSPSSPTFSANPNSILPLHPNTSPLTSPYTNSFSTMASKNHKYFFQPKALYLMSLHRSSIKKMGHTDCLLRTMLPSTLLRCRMINLCSTNGVVMLLLRINPKYSMIGLFSSNRNTEL